MAKYVPLSVQLREAIMRYPGTRADLCREAGVDQSALSRFMSKERGLSIDDLDAIGRALNLYVRSSTWRTKGRP